MGTDELRKRGIWQDTGVAKAANAEYYFFDVFEKVFEGTNFIVRPKPQEFSTIYVNFPISERNLSEIYSPPAPILKHGIAPDYAIEYKVTRKTLYVEVKRQDGWVEGKPRSAGRGNAHERSCKYFTPGLLKILRRESGIHESALPFWTVFQGDITRDPCRVREISCWYDKYTDHYFFWRDTKDPSQLVEHFDQKLKHLLY
ncbi:MAG: MunI family type II restriction endonuclease [Gammaproteobacteria bacterium]|nr:MunI family type II restriction endonuclease [Gammaproteobacteria bacterium]